MKTISWRILRGLFHVEQSIQVARQTPNLIYIYYSICGAPVDIPISYMLYSSKALQEKLCYCASVKQIVHVV